MSSSTMQDQEVSDGGAKAEPQQDLKQKVQALRLDSQLGNAKSGIASRIAWLPWLLCLLMGLAWSGYAIRNYRPKQDDNSELIGSSEVPVTEEAESQKVQLEYKGYIIPAQQIAVSPIDVAGKVIELNFEEGKLYPKDHILARLDKTNFQAAYEEALATRNAALARKMTAEQQLAELKPDAVRPIEVSQLEAELSEAEALRDRALQEYDRLKSIKGSTTIAAREMDQAEADYRAGRARVDRLKASLKILKEGPRKERILAAESTVISAQRDVEAAEARLAQAQWRLDNCVIKAPIAGTVLTKKAEVYNLVNPLAFGATSGSICDIADLSKLEVELEILERDISKISKYQKCRIRTDAYPRRDYLGYLERIMPIANRAKNIILVRVKVVIPPTEVPGTYLKPEMGAVVTFFEQILSEEEIKSLAGAQTQPPMNKPTEPNTKK